jgi:predicted transport protein
MADQALIKKLGLKPKQRLCVLNAPAGYLDRLKPLLGGAELADTPEGDFDFVHLFVVNKAELEQHFPTAVQALKPDGLLWISYPKGRAKVQTDLTRDEGWAAVTESGWQSVAMISIDEVWSAVRFRPGQPAADQFAAQYAGAKAALRPIYDRLAEAATALGSDVALEPRKTYVALARGRQFGLIQPSTKSRVDLGLKLPGVEPTERLQAAAGFGSGQITHRVALTSEAEVDDEVLGWLKAAYEGIK